MLHPCRFPSGSRSLWKRGAEDPALRHGRSWWNRQIWVCLLHFPAFICRFPGAFGDGVSCVCGVTAAPCFAPLENTFFTLIDRSKAEDTDQRAETCISSHICVVYMNAKGTKIKYILLEKYMFCVKVFWSPFWSPSAYQDIIWKFQMMVSSFNEIGGITLYSDRNSLPSARKQEESFSRSWDAFQMLYCLLFELGELHHFIHLF